MGGNGGGGVVGLGSMDVRVMREGERERVVVVQRKWSGDCEVGKEDL